MRAITLPTLLVCADKGVVSPAVAEELRSLNPELQVEHIREAGHALHLDQPERFATIVQDFLRSVETADSRKQ
ncbi:alpha/beta fold hydrolase [Hymenobacter cellulosilyticus]|uniref:Alpha/beta hydrolase n=1 Tax=Hymenobacter cellulosilyticus TaxID=2932248 RepID=A0A8T9Q1S4_9BACT|nr:alpha/beta hydrolase [Hymenobacter cellulosilyticus]UOQ71434.1 alpha/beta hydrolase [Hymenobacter cellulosilyticus]